MPSNTNRRKTTDSIRLPAITLKDGAVKKTLPFNGSAITEKRFSFSFACFDRSHDLFNLGGSSEDGTVGGRWFIDLLDCFKSVNNMDFSEVKTSLHDLHPIRWQSANAAPPNNSEQYEYWQFRINKSKGRVIGFIIDGIFYVVWLDPHHNLTDSEGYGSTDFYKKPLSQYEVLQRENTALTSQNSELQSRIDELEKEFLG